MGWVLINANGWNGWKFFLRVGAASPVISLHRVTSKNADCIFEDLSIYV